MFRVCRAGSWTVRPPLSKFVPDRRTNISVGVGMDHERKKTGCFETLFVSPLLILILGGVDVLDVKTGFILRSFYTHTKGLFTDPQVTPPDTYYEHYG